MIAPAMPADGGNGLAMRLGMFLEALATAGDVALLVIPVAGQADAPPRLPARLGVTVTVIDLAGRADTHFALLSRLADPAARLAAFRAFGRPSLAAALSRPVLAEAGAFLAAGGFDLVHVGRLYCAEAALAHGGTRTIDLDDDDASAFRTRAAVLRMRGEDTAADWALAEADAFAALRVSLLPRFDATFSAGVLDDPAGTETIPNAVVLPGESSTGGDGRTIVFVGALGYDVNVDGILWFAREIWPSVRAASAKPPRLLIVGRDPPPAIRALDSRDGMAVLAEVDDLAALYRSATLAVAPLRSGGGTRIKLIEAAAWRVPFVATAIAASGLAIGNEGCGFIADDAAAFTAAILAALGDPGERGKRAARAAEIVRRDHDRAAVVASLAARFRGLAASAMVPPATGGAR
jgi:glycosyltransferase involved in cell wall biosynthesis